MQSLFTTLQASRSLLSPHPIRYSAKTPICATDLELLWGATLISSYLGIYQLGIKTSCVPPCLPGRGMCMPGKGTLKGGTMTGGKAGSAAVGWATL